MECRRDKAQTDEELESKRGLLGMGMACPLWTTRWEGQVLSPASPQEAFKLNHLMNLAGGRGESKAETQLYF